MPRQKRRQDITEEKFLEFAKSYLSEAFPNPERNGCPADCELTSMAERPSQAKHASVSQHLTCCSPCFNRYMEVLAELKSRKAE
jgi:hypothetical protein